VVSKNRSWASADNSAEVFDSVHGSFRAAGIQWTIRGSLQTAILLGNGTVLLAGEFANFSGASVNASTDTLSGLLGWHT
jgi:hypothetical protein